MRKIVVNAKGAKRLRDYFPWVYKSDIVSDLDFEPGELVEARDEKDRFLAKGYVNPYSTIAFRVLTYKDEPITKRLLKSRILRAAARRVGLDTNACRILHSEGDFLPGLIVDRYDEYLSVHFQTAGMVRFKAEILDLLLEIFEPKGMYVAADRYLPQKERVPGFKETIGQIPDRIVIQEHGVKFYVDILHAQKTGFYLDQRRNRKIVADHVKQKDMVLDCFSNIGGFGLYAALKGAKVRLVDISEEAIELAKENFALNEVSGEFVVANVFDYLRELRKQKERFDLILLDPPSFTKSKAKKSSAMKGFKDITVNAMKLLQPEGMTALFSCSHHVEMEDLKKVVREAAKDNKEIVEVIEHLYQDIDHPYILNNEFSLYLKGLLCKVVDL